MPTSTTPYRVPTAAIFPAERNVEVRRAEEEEVAGFPERMEAASEHRPGVEDDSFEVLRRAVNRRNRRMPRWSVAQWIVCQQQQAHQQQGA